MADWNDSKDEEAVRGACKEIIDVAEAVARRNGTYLPFQYSNYSSRDQNPLNGYGEENLERLIQVASRYDPEGIFQTLQNGGWLISKI